MPKFIHLTTTVDRPILINLSLVIEISPNDMNGKKECILTFSKDNSIIVKDSFEEVYNIIRDFK